MPSEPKYPVYPCRLGCNRPTMRRCIITVMLRKSRSHNIFIMRSLCRAAHFHIYLSICPSNHHPPSNPLLATLSYFPSNHHPLATLPYCPSMAAGGWPTDIRESQLLENFPCKPSNPPGRLGRSVFEQKDQNSPKRVKIYQ